MCILRYARGYTSYLLLVWLGKEDWSPSISVFTPTLYQKYFLTLAETDRKTFYFFEILITFFSLVLAVATMVVVYKVMKKREFNGQRKNNKWWELSKEQIKNSGIRQSLTQLQRCCILVTLLLPVGFASGILFSFPPSCIAFYGGDWIITAVCLKLRRRPTAKSNSGNADRPLCRPLSFFRGLPGRCAAGTIEISGPSDGAAGTATVALPWLGSLAASKQNEPGTASLSSIPSRRCQSMGGRGEKHKSGIKRITHAVDPDDARPVLPPPLQRTTRTYRV